MATPYTVTIVIGNEAKAMTASDVVGEFWQETATGSGFITVAGGRKLLKDIFCSAAGVTATRFRIKKGSRDLDITLATPPLLETLAKNQYIPQLYWLEPGDYYFEMLA